MSDARELLIELVKRYSPSEKEAPAVEYLVEWMNAHDFKASVDEAGNAVGIRGNENAPYTLMLLGHIDTVHGEIPVRIEESDGEERLYGRGSVDAKGSLCTFAAAAALATIPESWCVVVVGAVEEETSTSKGARHIRKSFNPNFCVIGEPSSAERVTLGYKGRLIAAYKLTRPITHTARPEPSVGAIGATFWQKIVEWERKENEGFDRYFDRIMANLRSINTSSDNFYESIHMMIGFRLPPRFSPNDVIAVVSTFADSDSELSFYGKEPAYLSEKNTLLVRKMLAAIRSQNKRPGFVVKTGTSDMNVVGAKWTCPIVAYGPGDSNLDHTPLENLVLSEYDLAVMTMKHFIENIDGA